MPAGTNPFGLADVGRYSKPMLVDMDSDGDLDALFGNEAGNTVIFRNTGTTDVPSFSLEATNRWRIEARVGASKPGLSSDQVIRMDFRRARSLIRFRMVTPMAASVRWPGGVQA